MFAVIYRWKLKPGMEEHFEQGWARVTRAVFEHCGSYGSRLHVAEDGMRVAYARWPDEATRRRCDHGEAQGLRMMRESIQEALDEIRMTIDVDLLSEPKSDG